MPPQKIPKTSNIIGIQFSILSADEIRKSSVVEVTNRESLFDPRMGVIESGYICPTDGLDYIRCPGYHGHLELARPVYYTQYFINIIKTLQCVCLKCSKLLISKETYKHVLKLPEEQRAKFVHSVASKIKRCGANSDDGCGYENPHKITKEGIANIQGEWLKKTVDDETGNKSLKKIILNISPEIVLNTFRQISDEDAIYMGYNPLWSRPDWMICQVLLIPPPAVRPYVKHDAQQRSEDDLTHILVNILKTNKTIQDKIDAEANPGVIDEWTMHLQYLIGCFVDNRISGAMTQRSGRVLKSIKDRLNGKTGRMRGNLMAKRVDFSARSVITADPKISIEEVGVPVEIVKVLTKPVEVNDHNRNYLTSLVQRGPDNYPGANIVDLVGGRSITLRYADRESIILKNGDVVHRHLVDGDPVLFNRQPSLHKMSMMCHKVRTLYIGNTFRMNVANTKPYNADFDKRKKTQNLCCE